ncbi:MAG: DUF2141 domain-containing protein [Saprospiraceae bacterium]
MWIKLLVLWTNVLFMPAKQGELVLYIQNIENAQGTLYVAVYNESNFLQEGKGLITTKFKVEKSDNQQVEIPNLPFGTYAIAIYHDVNNNGKLDKNALGIPAEPYAFSNNPKVKWRSPTFDETQIELNAPQKSLEVELKRWRKH